MAFGRKSTTVEILPPPRILILGGDTRLDVVGEAQRQKELRAITGSSRGDEVLHDISAILYPELTNPVDSNAIAVYVEGLPVGYLAENTARMYQRGLITLMAQRDTYIGLRGVVAGGRKGEHLGVFLRHETTHFLT